MGFNSPFKELNYKKSDVKAINKRNASGNGDIKFESRSEHTTILGDVFVNFSTHQETVWIVSHLGCEHLSPKSSPSHNLVALHEVNNYTRTSTRRHRVDIKPALVLRPEFMEKWCENKKYSHQKHGVSVTECSQRKDPKTKNVNWQGAFKRA